MKRVVIVLAAAAGILVAGCSAARLEAPSPVRSMSNTDDRLFHDLAYGSAGVGSADRALYPASKKRRLSKVQVLVPYDNRQAGLERWTISHDDGGVSYLVELVPDGRGGTHFRVRRESDAARATAAPSRLLSPVAPAPSPSASAR